MIPRSGRRRLTRPPATAGSAAWLSSLVDLLTLLLLFLLRSYSTDPPVRPGDLDFQLPTSTAEAEARGVLTLDVTRDAICRDGARAAGVAWYLDHDEALIDELYAPLLQAGGPSLMIRAHEDTPYALLRKLLVAAREAGVEEVQLVAVSRAAL